jgi:hypothetical protein
MQPRFLSLRLPEPTEPKPTEPKPTVCLPCDPSAYASNELSYELSKNFCIFDEKGPPADFGFSAPHNFFFMHNYDF